MALVVSTADFLADGLRQLTRFLERHGVWYSLAFGTLLGAVRDRDIIPWDHDVDLFIRPADAGRIVRLNPLAAEDGLSFTWTSIWAGSLALNPREITASTGWRLVARRDDLVLADLYPYALFSDGVLRWYDVEYETYWNPECAFPHWFVEELDAAVIRGATYPVPRAPERWLEGIYGPEWSQPFRPGDDLGEGQSVWGYRLLPKLETEIAWCESQGWDRSRYRGELQWPRPVAAAGPLGFAPEGTDPGRVRWWTTLEEVTRLC